MRKKQKKILGIILAIALVVGLIYAFNQGIFQLPFVTVPLSTNLGQCLGGWTTLSSPSSVDVVGEGNRIRIYGVAKGAECLQIAFTQEQLNQYIKGKGYYAEKPIYGSIKLLGYTTTYPITSSGKCYRTISNNLIVKSFQGQSTMSSGPSDTTPTIGKLKPGCNVENCKKEGYPNTIWAYNPGPFYYCRCVLSGCNGNYGTFSGAEYGDYKVQFSVGDESTTLTRSKQTSSDSDGSFTSPSGKFRIEWTGNLNNLDKINVPYQYEGRLVESKWQLVNIGSYTQVEGKIDIFNNCMLAKRTLGWTGDTAYNSCKTQFDSGVSSILTGEQTSTYKSSLADLIYDANTDNNALYLSMKASPFPTFILDLDAVWVGIVQLKGKPKITQCAERQELKSGTNKIIIFKVKNEANVNAEFYGSVSCDKSVISFISNFQINANEEKTISINLIPSAPENDLSWTCTIKINDLKSENYDTCSFSGDTEYVSGIKCTPLSKKCSDDLKQLGTCKADGSDYDWKICDYGCEYAEGSARCIGVACKKADEICKENADCCEGLSCNSGKCSKGTPSIFNWLIAIPILLTIGLSALFGWKGKKGRKYNVMDFVIGGVLGGVIGMVLYFIIKHWLILTLLALLGVGGTIGAIILLGGTPLLIFLISLLARRR